MGEYLSRLFPDPLQLPGGDSWKLECRNDNVTAIGGWDTDTDCSWNNATADIYGFIQVLFLGAVYAMVLFYASNEISDGSEKLLLIKSWRGIVGTIVLPILGAVPDGAIVLFSGLGSNAQEQISVGVGALAGSTIMLLTIPWFLSVFAGRVKIENGFCNYQTPKLREKETWSQYFFESGVEVKEAVSSNANIMIVTAISYFLCQAVLFATGSHGVKDKDSDELDTLKTNERWFALGSCALCVGFFGYYLYLMISNNNSEAKVVKVIKKAFASGDVDVQGLFTHYLCSGVTCALELDEVDQAALREVAKGSFRKYDRNNNKALDHSELKEFLRDIGFHHCHLEVAEKEGPLAEHLKNKTKLTLEMFLVLAPKLFIYMNQPEFLRDVAKAQNQETAKQEQSLAAEQSQMVEPSKKQGLGATLLEIAAAQGEGDDEEEEEEEEDETLKYHQIDGNGKKTVNEAAVKVDAFKQMAIGTLLVLLFSDPMCDVFTSIGNRIGIDAFFISFVLAPLASNASELIAALNFAGKKTKHSVTVSLTQLEGAAIMNNTFCLGIFMLLIFAKGLVWTFSAETISIFAVQVAMFGITKMGKTENLFKGCIVLALYPMSIVLVIVLENVIGLD